MRAGGLAVAVKNARAEVKKEAHYVTPHAGGEGALRDAVEFILKAQGKWKKAYWMIILRAEAGIPLLTVQNRALTIGNQISPRNHWTLERR